MSTLREALPRTAPVNSNAGEPRDGRAEEVVRVLRDDGTLDPALDPALTPAEVTGLYRAMVTARRLDVQLAARRRQDHVGAPPGSPGAEAAVLGSAFALRPQDWIFPGRQELAAALVRGCSLRRHVDSVLGDGGELAGGRRGSRAAKIASVSSPGSAHITQAVGFAWAARMRREELVTLAYFGEGATSSAEFHNGLNFAGVFRTPSVFLCRNDGRAGAPTAPETASDGYAVKGQAYGVPGVRVDGADLFAVVKVTRDAIARASRGEGATLIEALTCRVSEVATSERLDPIPRLRRHLERAAGWSEARDRQLEAELDAEIRAAVAAADQAPPPPLDALFDDVYAELPWHLAEQREALRRGPRASAR